MRTLDTLFKTIYSRSTSLARYAGNYTQSTDRTGRPPVISYTVHGTTTLLNQWTDPSYFTAAFPTLFPNGTGGHLEDRDIPVDPTIFERRNLKAFIPAPDPTRRLGQARDERSARAAYTASS